MMQFKPNTHRQAFSMITAIFVIVIMASVGALIMNLTGKMVKDTTFQFRKEQAVLLARSYTELAIMSATANEGVVTNCTDEVTGLVGGDEAQVAEGGGYKVNAKISYVGNGLVCGTILNTVPTAMTRNIYIIVDAEVKYKDSDLGGDSWVSYRRRTTQKL